MFIAGNQNTAADVIFRNETMYFIFLQVLETNLHSQEPDRIAIGDSPAASRLVVPSCRLQLDILVKELSKAGTAENTRARTYSSAASHYQRSCELYYHKQ